MTHRVTVVHAPQRVVVARETNRVTTVRVPERVVVRADVPSVRVVRTTQRVVVRGTGAQGPAGPPGPGYTSYFHTQVTPASAWVIDHNLGRRAHVTIYVPDGTEVEADVVWNTPDQVVINFPEPYAGTALIA